MLVIVVVHRHYSWVGLVIASLLCQLALYLLVPGVPVLREEELRSVPAQGPLGPVSEVHGVFSSRDLHLLLL